MSQHDSRTRTSHYSLSEVRTSPHNSTKQQHKHGTHRQTRRRLKEKQRCEFTIDGILTFVSLPCTHSALLCSRTQQLAPPRDRSTPPLDNSLLQNAYAAFHQWSQHAILSRAQWPVERHTLAAPRECASSTRPHSLSQTASDMLLSSFSALFS